MRFHPMLLAMPMLFALLGGCLGDADTQAAPPAGALTAPAAGQYGSHPGFSYLTNGLLPVADDGVTRHVAGDGTVHWFRPAGTPLPESITGLSEVTHVEGTATGGGIAVFGPLAFIGGRTSGPLQVVDISDPTAPFVAGEVPDVPVRDADTILYPDGRLVVITTAGGGDQFATDVTDPTAPEFITSFETEHGNHNIAVVPGTPIVYNSGSRGVIDIVDYSDPRNPVAVGTFENGNGCHDIMFHIDRQAEMYRAYCAGYPETEIWDITDPVAPQMVVEIPYPGMDKGLPVVGSSSPLPDTGVQNPVTGESVSTQFPLSFSHLAMVNHDASILIVGDETGGGGINGCDFYDDTSGTSLSGPIGNLWFYDVSDETSPVLLSHVSPEAYDDPADAQGSCTAHFGRLLEDRDLLAMSFYTSGVLVVDFNDPSNPLIVSRIVPEGAGVWDVWYHQGYLFTGDMNRGMDVLGFQ